MSLTAASPGTPCPEILVITVRGPVFREPCVFGRYTDRGLAIRHTNETVHNDKDAWVVTLTTQTANHPHDEVTELLRIDATEYRKGTTKDCPCQYCAEKRAGTSATYSNGHPKMDDKPVTDRSPCAQVRTLEELVGEEAEEDGTPPMIKHYRAVQAEHPGILLFMRVGDFYEAYDEHAETVAQALNITLTGRDAGGKRISMAGVPHHATERYVARLIRKGFRVALMDEEGILPQDAPADELAEPPTDAEDDIEELKRIREEFEAEEESAKVAPARPDTYPQPALAVAMAGGDDDEDWE